MHAHEPAAPAIALRGVSKEYGGREALKGVDLDIAEGEFFCLLGPSGCGKTTTLNLIGGFVAPSAGAVYIRGAQVDRLPPHRRDANTVFQSIAAPRKAGSRRPSSWSASAARRNACPASCPAASSSASPSRALS
jgi:ABC-type oligopeptide transport system ATPase subunit